MVIWLNQEPGVASRPGLGSVAQEAEQVAEVVVEPVGFTEFDGVGQGVAGGADPDAGVRVLDSLCGENGYKVRHEGLELLSSEFVGLPVDLGELFAEGGIVEPAAQGSLRDTGLPGGLGDGGGEGEDREDGLLAGSEAGNFYHAVISGRFRRLVAATRGMREFTGLSAGGFSVFAFWHET